MLVISEQSIPNASDEIQSNKASSKTFDEMPTAMQLLEYTISSAR